MSNELRAQISALADDALDAREAELLLARLARDAELRAVWEQYHLVGEIMRDGAATPLLHRGFAADVAAAIRDDAPPPGRHLARARALLRPAAGLAIAASVAMLAVISMPGQRPGEPVIGSVPGDANPAVLSFAPVNQAQQDGFSGVRSAELQNQLRSYLINYGEHASGSRLRGVMPYVQIAAHGTRTVALESDAVDTPPQADDQPDYYYRNRR